MLLLETKNFIKPDEGIRLINHVFTDYNRMHLHEFLELTYIFSGRETQTIDDQTFDLGGGSLYFVDIGQKHSINVTEAIKTVDILVAPEFFGAEYKGYTKLWDIVKSRLPGNNVPGRASGAVKFTGEEADATRVIVEKMYAEFHAKRYGYIEIIRSCLWELLFRMARCVNDTMPLTSDEKQKRVMADVIEYISLHIAEKLTLSDVAEKYHYNPSYFSRLFRKQFGVSFTEYINTRRLRNSRAYLCDTTYDIERISELVGYNSKTLYYRKFLAVYGETPGRFRHRKKAMKESDNDEIIKTEKS